MGMGGSMRRVRQMAAGIFAVLFFALFAWQVYYELHPAYMFMPVQRIIFSLLSLICAACAAKFRTGLYDTWKEKRKIVRFYLGFLFALYLFHLFWMLFLDPAFGRDAVRWGEDVETYRMMRVNLQPFDTIKRYLYAWEMGNIREIVLTNLVGNFAAFMPFAFFLPSLFNRQRKLRWFLPTMALLIVGVEGLQWLTRLGSCDIDDFILNFAGVVILFFFLKIPPLRRIWEKTCYL